jgi:hypothetical protein
MSSGPLWICGERIGVPSVRGHLWRRGRRSSCSRRSAGIPGWRGLGVRALARKYEVHRRLVWEGAGVGLAGRLQPNHADLVRSHSAITPSPLSM